MYRFPTSESRSISVEGALHLTQLLDAQWAQKSRLPPGRLITLSLLASNDEHRDNPLEACLAMLPWQDDTLRLPIGKMAETQP